MYGLDGSAASYGGESEWSLSGLAGLAEPDNSPFSLGDTFSEENVNVSPTVYTSNQSPTLNLLASDSELLSEPIDQSLFPTPMSSELDLSHNSQSSKRSPPSDPVTALKRQRNNIAAKKYRQKKVDRITELESELEDVRKERDELRIRLARQEAETAALRSMLQMKSGSDAKGQSD